MRLESTNIQQIGNELAIHGNDETESYLDCNFRRACPCAPVAGARRSRKHYETERELLGEQFLPGRFRCFRCLRYCRPCADVRGMDSSFIARGASSGSEQMPLSINFARVVSR